MIREKTKAPLIGFWMQESLLAPPLVPALPAFNGVVFNSEWQKKVNQRLCPAALAARPLSATRCRSDVCPNLFPPEAPILAAKTKPPVLLYAGVTPRGAFHLPALLDRLRQRRTDFSMEIYCDCAPSRDVKSNADYIEA